jgi:drug/metabolite transporter (DMT)-like permease
MLVACCALWALSFPSMRAILISQGEQFPERSSWFLASLCVGYRFAIAAAILAAIGIRKFSGLTRCEASQGIGIGLFGGIGIILQTDGLAHTSASVSAFLTQCYALFIPLWVAFRSRRPPTILVIASCVLVMSGAAVLSGMNWTDLRMGRGELETIAAAVCFGGQILWLERPRYARNDVTRFAAVSFAVMALLSLPVAVVTAGSPSDFFRPYASGASLGFLAILVLPCTLGGYMLMNRWQPHVSAPRAGLIYCLEPVFTSALTVFLPAIFSTWAGVNYPNEPLSDRMLLGGGLILSANSIIVFDRAAPRNPVA